MLKLKLARIQSGMTQRELAGRLQISENHLSKLETGRVSPGDELLQRIESFISSGIHPGSTTSPKENCKQ